MRAWLNHLGSQRHWVSTLKPNSPHSGVTRFIESTSTKNNTKWRSQLWNMKRTHTDLIQQSPCCESKHSSWNLEDKVVLEKKSPCASCVFSNPNFSSSKFFSPRKVHNWRIQPNSLHTGPSTYSHPWTCRNHEDHLHHHFRPVPWLRWPVLKDHCKVHSSRCFVWSLSRVWLFGTPQTAARQASLSFTISRSLLRLTSIVSVMPSSHLTLCHPHRVMIQRTCEDQLLAEQGTALLEKQKTELSSKHGEGF